MCVCINENKFIIYIYIYFISFQLQIRVVNAFQMDLDTHLDSYDKRSRPSVASLPSLQLRSGPFKKNNLPNSPETESPSKPWLNRAESIPYADEP